MGPAAKPEVARPPRRFGVPPEGRFWLLATAATLAIGLFKGINLLTLLGCLMLALWAVNALLAGGPLRRLRGRRWIEGPVFAGTPAAVTVEATNAGRAAAAGVRLDDGAPGQGPAGFVPRLPSRAAVRLRREVVLPARGVCAWGALLAVSGYPFGLAQRRAVLAPAEQVVVLPRLGRLHRGRLRRHLPPVGLSVGRSSHHPRRYPTAQAEFHGLRAFRSGDSPRWIHWRTSARCNELMVREFEDVPANNLVLVLDPSLPNDERGTMNDEPKTGPDHSSFIVPHSSLLEDAISLAATICWEWCRQKGDRLVLAVAGDRPAVLDGVTGRDHALRLLECLAVLEPGTGEAGAGYELVLERLAGMPLPPAPVLLLSAGPSDLAAELGRRLRRPVACLDVSALSGVDFYEKPPDAAA
jgi:uncharacterized protein (DUF58 family)